VKVLGGASSPWGARGSTDQREQAILMQVAHPYHMSEESEPSCKFTYLSYLLTILTFVSYSNYRDTYQNRPRLLHS